MAKTLISVDLDWLNGSLNPTHKLKNLLRYISKTVPAILTIEHHEFLPSLRRWVEKGKVLTPFNIINFDEHHDYYHHDPPHNQESILTNCATWGYKIPTDWYNRYTWVHNKRGVFPDWPQAQRWLNNHGIKSSVRTKCRLAELKSPIVAAIFCVSPDYLCPNMWDYTADFIETIANHFGLPKVPTKTRSDTAFSDIRGWQVTQRPNSN